MFDEIFYGQFIAFEPETGDAAYTFARRKRVFPEFFPCINVGNMNLDSRYAYGRYSICDGNACMGICTTIEYDATGIHTATMQVVDDLALHIALKAIDDDIAVFFFEAIDEGI